MLLQKVVSPFLLVRLTLVLDLVHYLVQLFVLLVHALVLVHDCACDLVVPLVHRPGHHPDPCLVLLFFDLLRWL